MDVLANREPFVNSFEAVMTLATEGKIVAAICAITITDIAYLLRKHLEPLAIKKALLGLMDLLDVADVNGDVCLRALDLPMSDFEDAVLACCAKAYGAECIVTRNEKDFQASPINAISPDAYLRQYASV